jgi:hypothetical protein
MGPLVDLPAIQDWAAGGVFRPLTPVETKRIRHLESTSRELVRPDDGAVRLFHLEHLSPKISGLDYNPELIKRYPELKAL